MNTCSKCGGTFYCPEDDFYCHVTRCQGQESTDHRSAQLAEVQADLRHAQATIATLLATLRALRQEVLDSGSVPDSTMTREYRLWTMIRNSIELAEGRHPETKPTVAALTKALDDLYTVALGAHADTCGDLPTRRAIAQARVLLEKQQPEADAARMEAIANGERGSK